MGELLAPKSEGDMWEVGKGYYGKVEWMVLKTEKPM